LGEEKMRSSPILLLHICAGTTGVLSGFVAVFLRKGSRWHRIIGNVFFIAMLALGSSGAYMAVMKSQVTNILAGVLTCYLVATAWMTARRREGEPGIFDQVALLSVLAVATTEWAFGLEALSSPAGTKYGNPALLYFIFGSVALLAATGDVRMLVRRGISGTQRTARHLWRMCLALFVASGSIFLARPHLFPAVLRKTGVLAFLSFLPLILMVFWLIRIRIARASAKRTIPRGADAYSLQT
jgi:uncharacterized membrane protein